MHAIDAREYFLCVDRDVDACKARPAVAAIFAAFGYACIAEVVDDEVAQALGCMAVVDHLLQAAEALRLALRLFRRLADEELLRHRVLRRVEQDASPRLAITSGAACLLIVRFDVFRHIVVNDVAHVALVDAHAEGIRRDDDRYVVVEKIIL